MLGWSIALIDGNLFDLLAKRAEHYSCSTNSSMSVGCSGVGSASLFFLARCFIRRTGAADDGCSLLAGSGRIAPLVSFHTDTLPTRLVISSTCIDLRAEAVLASGTAYNMYCSSCFGITLVAQVYVMQHVPFVQHGCIVFTIFIGATTDFLKISFTFCYGLSDFDTKT